MAWRMAYCYGARTSGRSPWGAPRVADRLATELFFLVPFFLNQGVPTLVSVTVLGLGGVLVLSYAGDNFTPTRVMRHLRRVVFYNKNTSVKEVSDLEKLVRWIAPGKEAESAAGGGGGEDANDDNVDDYVASVAWAATSWARTAIAIKRVRATLQFEDEGQDARSRMAKELTALAEVGFSRMVRPHLPQAVVEDLYPR